MMLVLIFGLCVPGLSVKAYDLTVQKMRVIMVVSENGLISVDTTVDVNFGILSHGIFVYVPQDYQMTWTSDGKKTTKTYHWPVTNLQVFDGVKFEKSISNGLLNLRLGDPDVLFIGDKSYHYAYDIQMKDLGMQGIQLFYMDIVGTGWEMPINEVEYQITLPKGWPEEIFLYRGPQGSNQTIQGFTVDQNVLSGTAENLMPYEGLTIYTQLSDDGTYIQFIEPMDYTFLIVLASLLLLIVLFLIHQKFGKDHPLVVTPQFGPIKGLSSSQIGYIIDGSVTPEDMVSVFIEWAYKGYLRIIDNDDSSSVRLEKLKAIPDEENEGDKALFNAVFYERDSVSIETLQEDTRDKLPQAGYMIKKEFESLSEHRIFETKSFDVKLLLCVISLIPYFLLLAYQLKLNDNLNQFSFIALFFMMVFAVVILILWIKLIDRWFTIGTKRKFFMISLSCTTGILFLFGILLALSQVYTGQAMIVFKVMAVFVCSAFSVRFGLLMDRRSQRGSDLLGQVIGLRNFIELAEKDRIIELAHEDPYYFYKLLPYAYLFGITETWTDKFSALTVQPPDWYVSNGTFNTRSFTFRLLGELDAIKIDLPSLPDSKEIGGALLRVGGSMIRKGGHSGGGFGGGGGGRW